MPRKEYKEPQAYEDGPAPDIEAAFAKAFG